MSEEKCGAAWGNCTGEDGIYFGKSTATPHICGGGNHHHSKLHRCEKCGGIGHRILPTGLTRAGRQLKLLLDAHAKTVAQQKHRVETLAAMKESDCG